MSGLSSTMNGIGNSVMTRLMVIGALVLALLVPMGMVKGIIQEREQRQREVISEVSGKWGREQTIVGPILTIPYDVHTVDGNGKIVTTVAQAHLLPEQLTIGGTVRPEIRARGIYKAVLYNGELQIDGDFRTDGLAELGIAAGDIRWHEATVSVGLPDLRGVKENNLITWNDESFPINSGIAAAPVMDSGVSARVPMARSNQQRFSMKLNLNGSGQLSFVPLGKVTTVQLASPWKDPSFSGPFLPDRRQVTGQGFTADWKILHLNRNYPQQWTGKNDKVLESAFGARFFCPVDEYQKSMRSAKYAVLFIVLTFVAFFITEVTGRTRVHPVQYLLIGFAICLFYLLLLSIAEHTGFAVAYLIAAAGSALLVTGYSRGILRSSVRALTVGGLMTFLYGFLYVTLQLEDFSLLMGSSGMFVVLGVIMFLTRKIDWYGMSADGASLPE